MKCETGECMSEQRLMMNIRTFHRQVIQAINYQGSHSLAHNKISGLFQDFPRTLKTFFQDPCRSPTMLNYRQTAVTYCVYTV